MKHLTQTVLSGLFAISVSAAPVWAQAPLANPDVSLSERAMAHLDAGGRVSVIVMTRADERDVQDSASGGFGASVSRQAVTDLNEQILREALDMEAQELAVARAAGDRLETRGYRAFSVSPGFRVSVSVEELAALRAHPMVASVEENVLTRPMTDVSSGIIGANVMWARGFEGTDLSVAILDTGVEPRHPTVSSEIIASACFNSNITATSPDGTSSVSLCPGGVEEVTDLASPDAGVPCTDADLDPVNGYDGCAHGTHVGSTAAGANVPLSGGAFLTGMARGAGIVSVNVFSGVGAEDCVEDDEPTPDNDCVLSWTSDQIEALNWLFTNRDTLNLAAVNLSLGSGEFATACSSSAYENAVRLLNQADVSVIAATGNDEYTNGISRPACLPGIIAVGATNDSDEVASFSNDADILDLLAPGVSIAAGTSTFEPAPGAQCPITNSEPNSEGLCHYLGRYNGTSMATPHVAGAFVLLRDAFPTMDEATMLEALKLTGEPVLDSRSNRIHARIQVDAAHTFLQDGGALRNSVRFSNLRRYDARNTSASVDSFNAAIYTFQNTASAPRTVRIVSTPSWVETAMAGGGTGTDNSFTLNSGRAGTLTLSISGDALPSDYTESQVQVRVDGSNTFSIPVTLFFTQPVAATSREVRFGPFEWVGDEESAERSIFRLVGFESGLPQRVTASIERWGADLGDTGGATLSCDITVRQARYSGNEYLVDPLDFADCPDFGRGDLYLTVLANTSDVEAGLSARRFLFNLNGGVTDAGFDPVNAGRSVLSGGVSVPAGAGPQQALVQGASDVDRPQVQTQVTFGPFDWVNDANADLGSRFRISQIPNDAALAIAVAVDNAANAGYSGNFSDCTLTVRANRRGANDYLIEPQDLADCGAFGRGDLSFRITADSSFVSGGDGILQDMQMRRVILRSTGSLSDLHFDAAPGATQTGAAIGGGQGEIEFGPFEWTGDQTTPTQNWFRIAGLANGAPTTLDIAIANATANGYSGDFDDCSLTLRPERTGEADYLIVQSDFADCGDFGRGDLTFRVRAPLADMADGVRMRRFGLGAEGDVTDFGFDRQGGASVTPTAIAGGKEQAEFGPFEWVGDANAGTRGIFRVVGIAGGLPDRIDVSIANASSGAFSGEWSDCSLNLLAGRAGLNEYVILADDLQDCGEFVRADVRFRVEADAAVLADTMRMRRFSVTRAGGLTDFGFDNE